MGGQFERDWGIALAALVATLLLGFVGHVLVRRRLAGWVARTATELDDLVLESTRRHVPVWILLAGIAVAAHLAPLPERAAALTVRSCGVLFSLSFTLASARLLSGWFGGYARRSGAAVGATSLVQQTLRVVVLAVGGLFVLSNLGISVTPLLTALGIGSLAVALALQPTLSNLFAGFHLALARPIRVGDFVQLETGVKGHVIDIGWRATRVRELPNNVVVVPNSRLSDMVLTNYTMPEPEQSTLVDFGVAYGSDLAKVERVTIEVAKEVLGEVEGGVPTFEPFIRYHTFNESSIDLTVILRVKRFVDRYLVTHEFIKRLKSRFDREGIEIPFPQRVVYGRSAEVGRMTGVGGMGGENA